ncbi:Transcriptional regulator MraZ [Planctomycetes bacterium Poly30]|uniref:Transcriptional regulator MraZ n=1 Tax=Saltatorellus ferox TaxID=2528018 RepID=A0A518EVV4_9BACT|nr:Transcriptional regulator MraZ [Planctomycetes bacterium Poly30]
MSSLSSRFLGASEHPVDPKGRMSIAKRFQNALDRDEEGRLGGVLCVERRQDARCLWVFNGAGFDREMEKFDRGALDLEEDPDADHGEQRDFFEFTAPFTLDNSGRLVIPQNFREVVGIDDRAMAVGMNSRIEIWGLKQWENRPRGQRSPGAPKTTSSSAAQQSGDASSASEDSAS